MYDFVLLAMEKAEKFTPAFTPNPGSCERMAAHGARGIGTMLHGLDISVRSVTVKIGGSNDAWLTAQWHVTEISVGVRQ